MLNRRDLLRNIAATGIGTAVFHRALAQESQDSAMTVDTIKNAEWISGIELDAEQREEILESVKANCRQLESLRDYQLKYTTAPATQMRTISSGQPQAKIQRGLGPSDWASAALPERDEDIAFLPVTELAALIRSKKITSQRLVQIYMDRLKKYGPMLRCVVTLTEELALEQSVQADKEIAAGRYRGPLHGIPWGAKDLISVPGYPTTWGIPYFEDRMLDEKATVAARLESAGAVLVAKLSLGALAMGDQWFRGKTRSPWDARVGSSGSSAGSASATVAGLVGFSLGSETLGSIISPSRRCGASGFRPTFGRVSRFGCMPLSWSMDKIGPICRSIEDCALVFAAIHGADGLDSTTQNLDFDWPVQLDPQRLKIGYTKTRRGIKDRSDLRVLRDMGCELVEVSLPTDVPLRPLTKIIDVEGASVFDQLLRDGHTEGWNAWDRIFRSAGYISAVDFLRYQRVRTDLMHSFEDWFQGTGVDFLFNTNDLVHTNFTGHPSLAIPREYRKRNGADSPVSVLITGHLNDDARLLAFASSYQNMIDAHLNRPPLDQWRKQFQAETLDEEPKPEQGSASEKDPAKKDPAKKDPR